MRSCIFCGGRASTIEDAWPLWLMRQMGETPAGRIEAERGRLGTQFWQAVKPELRVKFVCANCNNGWMSQLEDRVKPIIEALYNKETVTLDSNDQITLAVWSLKNAMVFESLRPNRLWFFVEAERRELMDTLKPIHHITVWIAKCVEPLTAFCVASDLTGVAGVSGDQVKANVTTMCFGPLTIQVFSIKLPNTIPLDTTITADLRPGPWDNVTLQIWPPQQEQVIWPATVGLLGEVGLVTFCERWNPTNTNG